jgi:curli biogenesis system outer membrane secretion channel CsgG
MRISFFVIFLFFSYLALINNASAKGIKQAEEETEMLNGNATNSLPPYNGIKKEIGVENFDNTAGISGFLELGLNLAVMLKSALFDSGRFVVLDRQNLNSVIKEQDLQASGRSAHAPGIAQTGKIRSARYLAGGAISEVTYDRSGGGGTLGIPTPVGSFMVGGKKNTAQITCIVTLTDTTTSEIVAKERIVGRASEGSVSVGYSGYVSLGGGGFEKTPIGQAAQEIINQAVRFIALKMEEVPFSGTVISASKDGKVLVNRGANYNMVPGSVLGMFSAGNELLDPESGAVLGREDGKALGQLRVTNVKEKFSYCEVISPSETPEAGTIVMLPKSTILNTSPTQKIALPSNTATRFNPQED